MVTQPNVLNPKENLLEVERGQPGENKRDGVSSRRWLSLQMRSVGFRELEKADVYQAAGYGELTERRQLMAPNARLPPLVCRRAVSLMV